MTLRCWRRSMTASRPAHSASADLPVPGPAAQADDADLVVEQQVEGDPLLGGPRRAGRKPPGRRAPAGPACPAGPGRARWRCRCCSTRPVWQGCSRAASSRARRVSYSSSMSALPTDNSAMPVQPESTGSSARYSCASKPTEAAFTRSGTSLLTRTTSWPSLARLRATERIRVSLSPSRKPAGRTAASMWLSSTRRVPPTVADRDLGVQAPVLDSAGRRGGEVPGGRSIPARDGDAWLPAR